MAGINEIDKAMQALLNMSSERITESSITTDGSSGYIKWTNGVLEQWGTFAFSASSGTANSTITFPTAFLNTSYNVTMTGGRNFCSGGAVWALVENNSDANVQRTTTTAAIRCVKSAGNYALGGSWRAIGRWK